MTISVRESRHEKLLVCWGYCCLYVVRVVFYSRRMGTLQEKSTRDESRNFKETIKKVA